MLGLGEKGERFGEAARRIEWDRLWTRYVI
jgi:hypothetical protein